MLIFLAGPSFNISSPRHMLEAGFVSRVSTERSSGDNSQPNSDESDDHAQCDVQERNQEFAVAKTLESFEFKRGKSGVRPDKADWYQIAPIRAPVRSFRQQRNNKADKKRSGNIDDKCAVREPRAHPVADITAEPESRNRSEKSPEADHPVFVHLVSRQIPIFA